MAKTQLRLTVPLIAKITGTRSKVVIFALQEILGLIFLIAACKLCYQITSDKVCSSFLTLSLGFIYAGKAAFVDIVGFTDSFAYSFLLLALVCRNRVLIFFCLLSAYFTDERAIVSSMAIAFFFLIEYQSEYKNNLNLIYFFKSRLFTLIFSLIVCFILRYWLFFTYGLHTPSAGANSINFSHWDYLFWEGLQGFWLLIIIGGIQLFIEKRFFYLSIFVLFIFGMITGASMVGDLTRSVTYIFPIIFVALYFAEKAFKKAELRKIIILVSLISFLSSGSFYVAGQEPYYYQSLPIKIIGKLFR